MNLNPASVSFKQVTLASVLASEVKEETVQMIAMIQDGTNYQVVFSQDESLIGDDSFTELGVAMTKDGLITAPLTLLDGTMILAAYVYGKKYVGTVSEGAVTLEPPVGD